jgi:lysophospholipase L1-like esterase
MSPMNQRTLRPSANLRYWQKVKALFGASLIGHWPLNEDSGPTMFDFSGNGRNALNYNSLTLANTTGPDGQPAPYFDGVGSVVGLPAEAMNCAEGTLIVWVKAANWAANGFERIMEYVADGDNLIQVMRLNEEGGYQAQYRAGGVDAWANVLHAPTAGEFVCVAFTWSAADDTVQMFVNGRAGTAVHTLGVWAGALSRALLGAWLTTWKGWQSNAIALSRVATQNELGRVFSFLNPQWPQITRFTIIGDSISAPYDAWHKTIRYQYHEGFTNLINHAVAGATIMPNGATHNDMETQVAAAASDDADTILIELGTNDTEGGDMTALQAEIGANIDALRLSNPRATIYYMNILPMWYDLELQLEGAAELRRAAIAAICATKNVTCWDTHTDPWIVFADTSDGLHPTIPGGQNKIGVRALALLP